MFFPRDESIGAESDFGDFGVGWGGGIAAEINFCHTKNIGGTKEGTDVIETSDILGD